VPAGFLIMDEHGPRKLPDGRPDLRIAVLPPDRVTWFDTWDAVGLRGSQSQDFAVDDVFVAEEWTGSFFADSSSNAPCFRLPPMPTAPLHAAIVVGALKGMVDDLGSLAEIKKPAFGPGKTLAQDPVFTNRFGERAADVDMLDIANHHVAATFMRMARAGRAPDPQEYQRLHAVNARIHHAATEIANDLVGLAGSTALYMSNDMQRRWRDIRCAAQHVSASPGNYTALGAFSPALQRRTQGTEPAAGYLSGSPRRYQLLSLIRRGFPSAPSWRADVPREEIMFSAPLMLAGSVSAAISARMSIGVRARCLAFAITASSKARSCTC
jgi:hypothetical protein